MPEYQGKKFGATIIDNIIRLIPKCNFILYASPGKEVFYEKQNFKKMKTGMALFLNSEKAKLKGYTE